MNDIRIETKDKKAYVHHITKTLYRKLKKLEEWLLELEDKAINADD